MKLKDTNLKTILYTILLKNISFFLWFSLAIIVFNFLINDINKGKVTAMIIVLIIIYLVRSFIRIQYIKVSDKNYHNIKHSVEMYYFNKLKYVTNSRVDKIDKEFLANKILEVSYNITRFFNDIGEYVIPSIMGTIILVMIIARYSILVAFLTIVLFTIAIGISYHFIKERDDEEIPNYNDLLKDFVLKIKTIRKLNIFDYCTKSLDLYKDNDLVVVRNNDTVSSLKFNTLVSFFMCGIIVLLQFYVNATINKLIMLACIVIIMIKLGPLLFKISSSIKNIRSLVTNKEMLDSFFIDLEEFNYISNFDRALIVDGKVYYEDVDVTINIPHFELLKGDTVSIMGKGGEGKTTVLNILSGMTKLTEGYMTFDGKNQDKIVDAAHSTKDNDMFKMSLRDNLKLYRKVEDEEILSLIKEIGLDDFYESLPNGLDTVLDENYIKISMNQKQKLNLVRAVLMEKEIYFLDDPTFDLDIDEETKVANMIKKYFKNATVIIVTSRPVLTTICKKHYFVKNHTLLEKEPLL